MNMCAHRELCIRKRKWIRVVKIEKHAEDISTCEDLNEADHSRHGDGRAGVREIVEKGLVQQHILCS